MTKISCDYRDHMTVRMTHRAKVVGRSMIFRSPSSCAKLASCAKLGLRLALVLLVSVAASSLTLESHAQAHTANPNSFAARSTLTSVIPDECTADLNPFAARNTLTSVEPPDTSVEPPDTSVEPPDTSVEPPDTSVEPIVTKIEHIIIIIDDATRYTQIEGTDSLYEINSVAATGDSVTSADGTALDPGSDARISVDVFTTITLVLDGAEMTDWSAAATNFERDTLGYAMWAMRAMRAMRAQKQQPQKQRPQKQERDPDEHIGYHFIGNTQTSADSQFVKLEPVNSPSTTQRRNTKNRIWINGSVSHEFDSGWLVSVQGSAGFGDIEAMIDALLAECAFLQKEF